MHQGETLFDWPAHDLIGLLSIKHAVLLKTAFDFQIEAISLCICNHLQKTETDEKIHLYSSAFDKKSLVKFSDGDNMYNINLHADDLQM